MWNSLVWSKDAATGTTSTAYQSFWQAPGARLSGPLIGFPLSEIAVLAVSQTQVVVTSPSTMSPVLQTSAPIENELGPVAGVFESSPTTFHSIGVIERAGPSAMATPPRGRVETTSRSPTMVEARRSGDILDDRHARHAPEDPVRCTEPPVATRPSGGLARGICDSGRTGHQLLCTGRPGWWSHQDTAPTRGASHDAAGGRPSPPATTGAAAHHLAWTPRTSRRRSEIARFLGLAAFPGTRDDLLAVADEHQATDHVRAQLQRLPADERFENVQDVARALGLGTEEKRA